MMALSRESDIFSARQSNIRSFGVCPRRTILEMEASANLTGGYTGDTADLGTFIHLVAIRALQKCHANGETQMSTYDIEEEMNAAYAEGDIPLGLDALDDARWILYRFAEYKWDPRRFLALEVEYDMLVMCDDGIERRATGRPDIVAAVPQNPSTGIGPGVAIVDLKTGRATPRKPRGAIEGEPVEGRQYLSPRGTVQLSVYGSLVLEAHPTAEWAMLRELHLRSGEERIARMGRSELPQVKRQIGLQLQMLERAVAAPEDSPLRKPRPGRQCLKACAFTSSCPIPGEQRGLGAVDSDEDADEQFARFLTVDALRQQLRDRLKARFEESGYVATAPDGSELRWKYAADGKRTFGPCQPDDPRSVVEAEVS